MWPNLDPRTPHLLFSISENLAFWKCWKVCVHNLLFYIFEIVTFENWIADIWFLGSLTFLILKCSKTRDSTTCHVEIGKLEFGNWKFEHLKISRPWEFKCTSVLSNFVKMGTRKWCKSVTWNSKKTWISISSLSKTWNGKLVTFVFSSKGIPSTPAKQL